jgi:nicotinate-nucleotide adenylyltransferase
MLKKLTKDSLVREAQVQVLQTYLNVFGRTPLQQRLDDILGEAVELSRYTDLANMREEAGDLLSSLLQLINENGWSAADLLNENLTKIYRRKTQYRGLGRKLKVAILGGAFNPVTMGHIEVAKFVLDTSQLFDEVWLAPCYAHMFNKKLESPEHRLAMCNIAATLDGRIKVLDFELKNKLRGETYNLVKRLLDTPIGKNECDFSMIIGLDNANIFDQWVNYRELERMIRFVVVPRTGEKRNRKVDWYLKSPHVFLEPEKPLIEMSSTDIRQALAYNCRDPRYSAQARELLSKGLAPKVLEYIQEHNLYLPAKVEGA